MDTPWRSMEVGWRSMEVGWRSMEKAWRSMEKAWRSMEKHGEKSVQKSVGVGVFRKVSKNYVKIWKIGFSRIYRITSLNGHHSISNFTLALDAMQEKLLNRIAMAEQGLEPPHD